MSDHTAPASLEPKKSVSHAPHNVEVQRCTYTYGWTYVSLIQTIDLRLER